MTVLKTPHITHLTFSHIHLTTTMADINATEENHENEEDRVLRSASLAACKETSENFSQDHAQAKLTDLNATIKRATGQSMPFGQAPDLPDEPPCDCCGKDFVGKLACSSCKSAFYCSRECQTIHWKKKKGGHKLACEHMKQACEDAASRLVNVISDGNRRPSAVVSNSLWTGVDEAGPYKIALKLGLNQAIQKLMEEEIADAKERFEAGTLISYTQQIMCVLFRNGRCIPGALFSHVDSYRIKKYVYSSPDAFEKWFQASITMVSIFLKSGTIAYRNGNEAFYWNTQRIVRDIVAAWSLVWTSPQASKAILLGTSQKADEDAHTRANWIIQQVRDILPKFWELDESPDGSAIEGQVNTFTAIIQIRLEEYDINVGDFVHLLGLRGEQKAMYLDMAMPFGEAMIKKGRALITADTQAALAGHFRTGGNRGGTSAGPGKKKGKKNRR